jgi:hypothetical protein
MSLIRVPFSGPDAHERAQEYTDWKTSRERSASFVVSQAQSSNVLSGDDARLTAGKRVFGPLERLNGLRRSRRRAAKSLLS